MIKLKPGVRLYFNGGRWPFIMAVAHEAAQALNLPYDSASLLTGCTVTSGIDGNHLPNSLHYDGDALDFRTRHLDDFDVRQWAKLIEESGGGTLKCVIENTHLHVEYDVRESN